MNDERYPHALKTLLALPDRSLAGLFDTNAAPGETETIGLPPMTTLNLMSEPFHGKNAWRELILDLCATSPVDDNVLAVRLLNPAVPSQIWTHAEARLTGLTGAPQRVLIGLRFDPIVMAAGDRLWVQVFATEGLALHYGGANSLSGATLRPALDRVDAELRFSRGTMRPNILTWGRMFEFIPWDYGLPMPDVDAPGNFGGPFDTAYPWQAVLKINPGDRIATIYKTFGTNKYPKGRQPADLDAVQPRRFDAPDNAPAWAVHFRAFQEFRERIMNWWPYHQRSDGQVGGGWNDDVLLFGKNVQFYGDMPLDSNSTALETYNRIFDGFDRMGFYRDGYCRIWPTDQGHNCDFVRDRYKSLIYNLGDPRSALWAMEEAWHWEKPERTPVNYGDGSSFLFGKSAIEWYWNRYRDAAPYRADHTRLLSMLRTAAYVHGDSTFWRYTDAWNHIDDQKPI